MSLSLCRVEQDGMPYVHIIDGKRRRRLYFVEGEEPDVGTWMVVDPTLGSPDDEDILRVPNKAWRPAELNDLLDLRIDLDYHSYRFTRSFSSAEISDFLVEHEGTLANELRALADAATSTDRERFVKLIELAYEKVHRLSRVPSAAPEAISRDARDAYEQIEQDALVGVPLFCETGVVVRFSCCS